MIHKCDSIGHAYASHRAATKLQRVKQSNVLLIIPILFSVRMYIKTTAADIY